VPGEADFLSSVYLEGLVLSLLLKRRLKTVLIVPVPLLLFFFDCIWFGLLAGDSVKPLSRFLW
jgi:hypothetical protein